MNRNRTIVTSALASAVWLSGCADPCIDDGLIQEDNGACPAATGAGTGGGSTGATGQMIGEDATDTDDDTDSADGSGDASASGTDTGETESESESESESETSGPSCDNGIQDGDETDVDCGGSCPETCDDGEMCMEDEDCTSEVCGDDETCQSPTCRDGVQNGDETGVDCGGSCDPCPSGRDCEDDDDCKSGVCVDGMCVPPACDDEVQNGDETDVDCGGGTCPGCDDGEMCMEGMDCMSGVCDPIDLTCTPPTCEDGVQNGDETDVDCGGGTCPGCDDGEMCMEGMDCLSGVCDPIDLTCTPPACDDGVMNGDETDVDCGGGTCPGCDDGEMCLEGPDCMSMVCDPIDLTCTPPACDDGLQNGDETDEDCGGMCGATCEPGEMCLDGGDCLSAGCDPGTLTCNDYLSVVAAPACSESDGAPVTVMAVASGGTGGPYTYAWTPDDGTVVDPDMATTDINPAGFASYTVTADDGVNIAQDTVVVVNSAPFDLENNCTLFTADYNAGTGGAASITYDMGGTRACELGNNEFGLHLCDTVSFSETRLVGTVEVLDDQGDNDWVGLVWGAQDESNFYSLVWKQSQQDFFGCTTPGGVLVKRIEAAAFTDLGGADWYCPNDTADSTVLVLPTDPGSTTDGWDEGESYSVAIDFTATGSTVTITRDSDLAQIANFVVADTTFTSGSFGSTTLSQENACVGPLFGQCL